MLECGPSVLNFQRQQWQWSRRMHTHPGWHRVVGIALAIISSISLATWARLASMHPESSQTSATVSDDAAEVSEPILASKTDCPAGYRTEHADFNGRDYAPELYAQGYDGYVYSRHLAAMNEPLLWCGDQRESYRFTWLRTFHHPIAIRVTESQTGMGLVAIELEGAGGYEPGDELRRITRQLTTREEIQVRRAIQRAGMWSPSRSPKSGGLDGAVWLLEGRHASRYQAISRWSPEEGKVREAGLLLLELSGLNIDADEMY
jgi:hypothetical protein